MGTRHEEKLSVIPGIGRGQPVLDQLGHIPNESLVHPLLDGNAGVGRSRGEKIDQIFAIGTRADRGNTTVSIIRLQEHAYRCGDGIEPGGPGKHLVFANPFHSSVHYILSCGDGSEAAAVVEPEILLVLRKGIAVIEKIE